MLSLKLGETWYLLRSICLSVALVARHPAVFTILELEEARAGWSFPPDSGCRIGVTSFPGGKAVVARQSKVLSRLRDMKS